MTCQGQHDVVVAVAVVVVEVVVAADAYVAIHVPRLYT